MVGEEVNSGEFAGASSDAGGVLRQGDQNSEEVEPCEW